MKIHPYILSVKLVLNTGNSNDPVHVISEDAEYGEIRWELRDGKLFAGELAQEPPIELSEFLDLKEPPCGDDAIALENATAELVLGVFNLIGLTVSTLDPRD